jgi:ATP/ADP translocase
MTNALQVMRGLSVIERRKAGLMSAWFFLVVTTLWLLKPIRSASLLAHLGSAEIPYARLASVAVIALVVAVYSRIVDRFSRVEVARGATDAQRYKAKAFIDMFVDRGGKALSALALMAIIARAGVSIRICLSVALGALLLWTVCARLLGRAYAERVGEPPPAALPETSLPPARAGLAPAPSATK